MDQPSLPQLSGALWPDPQRHLAPMDARAHSWAGWDLHAAAGVPQWQPPLAPAPVSGHFHPPGPDAVPSSAAAGTHTSSEGMSFSSMDPRARPFSSLLLIDGPFAADLHGMPKADFSPAREKSTPPRAHAPDQPTSRGASRLGAPDHGAPADEPDPRGRLRSEPRLPPNAALAAEWMPARHRGSSTGGMQMGDSEDGGLLGCRGGAASTLPVSRLISSADALPPMHAAFRSHATTGDAAAARAATHADMVDLVAQAAQFSVNPRSSPSGGSAVPTSRSISAPPVNQAMALAMAAHQQQHPHQRHPAGGSGPLPDLTAPSDASGSAGGGGGASLMPQYDLPPLFRTEESRVVCLSGLDMNVPTATLASVVQSFGHVRRLWHEWRAQGLAFVSYFDIRHANACSRSLNGRYFGDSAVKACCCIPMEPPSDKAWNEGVLVVFNVSPAATHELLAAVFSQFGEVREVRDAGAGSPNKFVEFYDVRNAEAAARGLHRAELWGGQIDVKLSRPHSMLKPLMRDMTVWLAQLAHGAAMAAAAAAAVSGTASGGLPTLAPGGASTPAPMQQAAGRRSAGVTLSGNIGGVSGVASVPNFRAPAGVRGSATAGPPMQHYQQPRSHDLMGAMQPAPQQPQHVQPAVGSAGSLAATLSRSMPQLPLAGAGQDHHQQQQQQQLLLQQQQQHQSQLQHPPHIVRHVSADAVPSGLAIDVPAAPRVALTSPGQGAPGSGEGGSGMDAGLAGEDGQPLSAGAAQAMALAHSQAVQHILHLQQVLLTSGHAAAASAASAAASAAVGSSPSRFAAGSQEVVATAASAAASAAVSALQQHLQQQLKLHVSGYHHMRQIAEAEGAAENTAADAPLPTAASTGTHTTPAPRPALSTLASDSVSPSSTSHGFSQPTAAGPGAAGAADASPDSPMAVAGGPVEMAHVLSGADTRSSVMIRNIPNKYTQQLLLEDLDVHFRGRYDFFYLPIDFKNHCNVGYAFVNFIDYRDVAALFAQLHGRRWGRFNSEKVCAISYARIQGKAGLIARFQRSSVMEKDEECRPLIFHSAGPEQGKPEPFPPAPLQ